MSKLYQEYQKLKKLDSETLYLFKSGIFYISLNEDAQKLSELFHFKITNSNDTVTKCGFPQKRLDFYTNLLDSCSVKFEIIDSHLVKVENCSDYLTNLKINEMLTSIKNLDMNQITFQEAFHFLDKLHHELTQKN